jgi:hypothetical protein
MWQQQLSDKRPLKNIQTQNSTHKTALMLLESKKKLLKNNFPGVVQSSQVVI